MSICPSSPASGRYFGQPQPQDIPSAVPTVAVVGDVWEGADIVASSEDLELLQKIADSKETIIRFQGDRIYDLTVSDSDKTAIKQVLTAYEAQKSS